LTDGIENHLKLRIILLLQGIEFPGQFCMGCEYSSEADEGPHDLDINLNSTFAPKHTGEHSIGFRTGDPDNGK
jgi:hypothetical protein